MSEKASVTQGGSCACGNAPSASCVECGHPVCKLCVRALEKGAVCLKCRSFALKRDDERRTRDLMGRTSKVTRARVRRMWIFLPAVIALALAIMSSVVGTVLSEANGARTERRAREALLKIAEAEAQYHQRTDKSYALLPQLVDSKLFSPVAVPGYSLKVEVAKDGHTFWARAVPERPGLPSMILDVRGVIVYDGGSE